VQAETFWVMAVFFEEPGMIVIIGGTVEDKCTVLPFLDKHAAPSLPRSIECPWARSHADHQRESLVFTIPK